MRFFTAEEDQFLKDNYLSIPTKRMAKMLNRSEGTARQRLKLLGIVVPPDVVEKFKRDSQIKKGNISFNKGKKQVEYMSAEKIERTKATRFKKGNVCHNKVPVGSQRITEDGYTEMKVADPNKWEALHRLMWEETFGPIPKGYNVRFVTSDKTNLHPFNLELVSKAENMKANTLHRYPKEIANAIQLLGVVRRQINKKLKQAS
jgi:hypothetical protein